MCTYYNLLYWKILFSLAYSKWRKWSECLRMQIWKCWNNYFVIYFITIFNHQRVHNHFLQEIIYSYLFYSSDLYIAWLGYIFRPETLLNIELRGNLGYHNNTNIPNNWVPFMTVNKRNIFLTLNFTSSGVFPCVSIPRSYRVENVKRI